MPGNGPKMAAWTRSRIPDRWFDLRVYALALAGFIGCPQLIAAPASLDTGSSSPYLDMHASDPVRWRPWGRDVLQQARQERRLIFISAGYFSCYWCHVMQRESFQDGEVARVLNDNYISVIVDRELDPALDKQLLEFVEKYRGVGGWPLNVILTPDGYPLVGGVYFPRQQFLEVLVQMNKRWREDPAALEKVARDAAQPSRTLSSVQAKSINPDSIEQLQQLLVRHAMQFADDMSGGFGEQTKFPMVPQLESLLSRFAQQKDAQLGEFLRLTLDQMAGRGLRDHLAGGFFRYTTDPGWSAPHFEKMLYDNALLAALYLRAGRVFQRPDYQRVGLDTLDFILAQMQAPGGGYYAAFSAVNDEGTEGGYYLWTDRELAKILDDDLPLVRAAWQMQAPAVDHWYLPFAPRPAAELAREFGLAPAEVESRLAKARQALLTVRKQRVLPVDDKVLASWNALVLLALTHAVALGEQRYLEPARDLRNFIVTRFVQQDVVLRMQAANGSHTPGALDDYAYVASALLSYARIAGNDKASKKIAGNIVQSAWARFHTAAGWRLTDQVLLPTTRDRPMVADDVLPSASRLLLHASLELAVASKDSHLRQASKLAMTADSAVLWIEPFTYAGYVELMHRWQDDLFSRP